MRILVLEDEPSQQEVLSVTLSLLGYDVLLAGDIEEALKLLETQLDAAILDVCVPDPRGLERDGLCILSPLRAKHPDIRVAVFTGQLLSEEEMNLASQHHATVMFKPQSYDNLLGFLS